MPIFVYCILTGITSAIYTQWLNQFTVSLAFIRSTIQIQFTVFSCIDNIALPVPVGQSGSRLIWLIFLNLKLRICFIKIICYGISSRSLYRLYHIQFYVLFNSLHIVVNDSWIKAVSYSDVGDIVMLVA